MKSPSLGWPIAFLATTVLIAPAAAPLAAQDLPSADALIDGYVAAIGGRDAHLAPSSTREAGTVFVAGLGIEGSFERVHMSPNRMRMSISIPIMGEILTGFDGEIGWTVNPLVGPMLMEGAELSQTRELSDHRAALRDRELVPERETVEAAEYGGEPCWKVRLEWASGRESFDCYSQGSGLLIATEETQASTMGDVPVTTLYRDYREIAGLTMPARVTQSSVGQTLEITVQSFEIDSVDPSELLPPPAVRTLIGDGAGN